MNGVTRWELSQKVDPVKLSVEVEYSSYPGKTERPGAPLLQLDTANRDRYVAGIGWGRLKKLRDA